MRLSVYLRISHLMCGAGFQTTEEAFLITQLESGDRDFH